jgi:UPF0716 protein FxsA
MRYLIVLVLLAFPMIEFGVMAKIAESHGWGWVLAWSLLAATLGVALIKQARFALVARVAQALAQGTFCLTAVIESARTVFAGLLLIFPGIFSDLIAILLLLLPGARSDSGVMPLDPVPARAGTVIDGESRRER